MKSNQSLAKVSETHWPRPRPRRDIILIRVPRTTDPGLIANASSAPFYPHSSQTFQDNSSAFLLTIIRNVPNSVFWTRSGFESMRSGIRITPTRQVFCHFLTFVVLSSDAGDRTDFQSYRVKLITDCVTAY